MCLALVGCGIAIEPRTSSQVEVRITAPDPRTGLANRNGCSQLPTTPTIQAQLWVEGVDEPCALAVTQQQNGDLVTRGACAGVPTGSARQLTLQWFAVAPSQEREVLLAEATGQADISRPDSTVVEVVFDPSLAQLRPKTEAKAVDDPAEAARFNCDGDERSNLLELCADTLFVGGSECQ